MSTAYRASWSTSRRAVAIVVAFRDVDNADPVAAFEYEPGLDLTAPAGTYLRIAGQEWNHGAVGTVTPPAGFALAASADTGGSGDDHSAAAIAWQIFSGTNPTAPGAFSPAGTVDDAAAHLLLNRGAVDPTLIGTAVATLGSAGKSIYVARPADAEEGDFLLLLVAKDDDAGIIAVVASGWTQIGSDSGYTYFYRIADAPVEAEAWDIYAADALLGEPIATLENAKGRWLRSELHGLGEGGFTINRHAAEATEENLAEGNMIKVRIEDCGPDYIDGFFLPGEGDYTLLSGQGGQGREDLVYRGPGPLSYLDRARMTPCAFSLDQTIETWQQIWTTTNVPRPAGAAYIASDSSHVYVISMTTKRIYKVDQSTRLIVARSPVLWPGTTRYAAGLCIDPSDSSILWALEAPWLAGSSANTKVHKIDISGAIGTWNVDDTLDLGSAIKHTDVEASSTHLWLSRYDGTTTLYKRSKSTGSVVSSHSVSYKGTTQTKATGLSINGSDMAIWYSGTKRALIVELSAPTTVTRVISTRAIATFGGSWTTEGSDDFFYMVSSDANRTWKYQLTDQTAQCADDGGVFHPEQQKPGALAWRVLVEITHPDRPTQPVPELSFDFSEDTDSNGTSWPARTSTEEFTWRVGDRAWSDVLARLIPAGVTFDFDVNTMTLHAYVDADFGTDRTSASFGAGKVRFAEGINLAVNGDLGRRDNRGLPDTYMTVLGESGVYGEATLAGRYVREGFMQVSGPATEAVLDAIGDDELARQRLVSDALGFETLWGDPDDDTATQLAGRYIPKKHYWKGDLVRVDMSSGEFTYQEEGLRLYGTLITERDGGWRAAVDLGSAYKVPPAVTSISGEGGSRSGSSSGGGSSGGSTVITSIPLTFTDGEDLSIPRVTRVIAPGVTSPSPGVAQLPETTAGDTGLVDELLTDETDMALVLHPDGGGGVAFGAETDPIAVAHIADTTDAHDASAVSFTPGGSLSATNVQDAIEEVATEAAGSGAAELGPPELETHHTHLLTAHRGDIGSADSYPEVSLEAILQAVIKGADRVNIPMARSSDGTFWGSHDGTLDRTTSQTGNVSSKTDAQLATYVFDAGYGYDAGRHGSSIHLATVADFLRELRPYDTVVYWEVADTGGTLIADLAAEIVAAGEYWIERAIFLSFSAAQSAAIKAVDARLPVYGLAGYVDPPTDDPNLSGWLFDGTDGLNTRALVMQYAPTVPVYLFEVDTEYGDDEAATIETMYGLGVRDIFTNDLDAALEARARYQRTRPDDDELVSPATVPAYDTDGLILVDPGTNSVDAGSPPGVTVTTKWGIDTGAPYYDTVGADPGEEAALYWDPADSRYVLVPYQF